MRLNPLHQDMYYCFDRNPSKSKIPVTCIKLSVSKNRSPLKEWRSVQANTKTASHYQPAPLCDHREKAEVMLERCRDQINWQNQHLTRKIEEKEEKIEQLRESFRQIQRSRSKDLPLRSQEKRKTPLRSQQTSATPARTEKTSSLSLLSNDLSKFKLFSNTQTARFH